MNCGSAIHSGLLDSRGCYSRSLGLVEGIESLEGQGKQNRNGDMSKSKTVKHNFDSTKYEQSD